MVDQKNDHNLQKAIELFYFAYRAFTAVPDSILQDLGLGRMHHRILYFVGRNPGLNVNELLQILSISKQALNAPLRRLTELELIDVKIATHDRRVRQLQLSRKGKKLEARLTKSQLDHLSRAFGSCGESATQGWFQIMHKLPKV